MTLPRGTFQLGPDSGTLQVKTYREGLASRAGHDLVMDVTTWSANVTLGDDAAIEVSADPRSLEVRAGTGGVRPLTDKDRADIRKQIDTKVLQGMPISFRSTAVKADPSGDAMSVEGQLTIGPSTEAVTARLSVADDGRISGTIPLTQSRFGIKPYRGLMGALRIRDDIEIVVDARMPQV